MITLKVVKFLKRTLQVNFGSTPASIYCNYNLLQLIIYLQTHVVLCTSLSSPINGSISCNSTDVSHYEDQCLFSCDPGYELTGSSSRQCLPNGLWSGQTVTCNILRCCNPEVEITNSQLVGNCDLTYGSKCLINCSSGFSASGTNGVKYVCDDVNDEGILVKWRSIGSDLTCVDDINSTSKSVIFTEILHYLLFTHVSLCR